MLIGDELRIITGQVKAKINEEKRKESIKTEREVLIGCLKESAEKGFNTFNTAHLENIVPLSIEDGSLWSWLREEGLLCSGEHTKKGNYSYIIYW